MDIVPSDQLWNRYAEEDFGQDGGKTFRGIADNVRIVPVTTVDIFLGLDPCSR